MDNLILINKSWPLNILQKTLPARKAGGERLLEHFPGQVKWGNTQKVRVASVLIPVTLSLETVVENNPAVGVQGDAPVTTVNLTQLSPGMPRLVQHQG